MRYFSKDEIENSVGMRDAIEAVKQAFSMAEKGSVETPLRTVIRAETGTLLFMPAYSAALGMAVLKNVNVFPDNGSRGLPTTPAEILLIDGTTGQTLAVLDGTCITQLRTGAASGAAFDVLGKKDCKKGALIGTGGQAEAQLRAMMTVRKPDEVYIYSRDRGRREAFVNRMREKYASLGTTLLCADDPNECVEDADLIITVTTSSTPVFDGRFVKKGATISCVGTYEPDKHEIDPALLARADKIYCDSRAAALCESGDLLLPIRQGLLSPEAILGGLGEVINGVLPGRENEDEIIVFESVGTAAQDLTTSVMAYEKLTKDDK